MVQRLQRQLKESQEREKHLNKVIANLMNTIEQLYDRHDEEVTTPSHSNNLSDRSNPKSTG